MKVKLLYVNKNKHMADLSPLRGINGLNAFGMGVKKM